MGREPILVRPGRRQGRARHAAPCGLTCCFLTPDEQSKRLPPAACPARTGQWRGGDLAAGAGHRRQDRGGPGEPHPRLLLPGRGRNRADPRPRRGQGGHGGAPATRAPGRRQCGLCWRGGWQACSQGPSTPTPRPPSAAAWSAAGWCKACWCGSTAAGTATATQGSWRQLCTAGCCCHASSTAAGRHQGGV